MADQLKTAIIGFGKVSAGYAENPDMRRYYRYCTHAQVLADHPSFDWTTVVDPDEKALALAGNRYRIPNLFRNVDEMIGAVEPDVIVLATPPDGRLDVLHKLKNLKGLVVEKPLGKDLAQSRAFFDYCNERKLPVQVNLWRRGDELFRKLAGGYLEELIGKPQAVFCVYGNGLLNNGTHMVDFARMLFGVIGSVQVLEGAIPYPDGPIEGDNNIPFTILFEKGTPSTFLPLNFRYYRENGFDIWGEKGRLTIMQEGLGIHYYPRGPRRANRSENEIPSDKPDKLKTTVGHAFYNLYSNLADSIRSGSRLTSPLESALETERIIFSIAGEHV